MPITLKAARVNRGLTQQEAAKLIGVEADTLRSWESAKSFPKVPQIIQIEKIYGLPYSEINFLPSSTVKQ
jgi:transcriptional regulator with XRE-family HTH domain